MVNNETNIRLVNAHAEGNGGADDLYIFHQELILCGRTNRCLEAGMIRKRTNAVYAERGSNLFYFLPAQAINNSALTLVLPDEFDDLLNGIFFRADFIIQIG